MHFKRTGDHHISKLAMCSLALSVIILGGCSTVSVPKSDLLEFPEMQSDAANISEYPNLQDVPQLPDDLRTATQWDSAAAEMISLSQGFHSQIGDASPMSDAEIINEINALEANVKAYKLDDPPE